MASSRNYFLSPKIIDAEYLITKLRRDDLYRLCSTCLKEEYPDATILDFGARKAPYKTIFEGVSKRVICADFPVDEEDRDIDVVILKDGSVDLPDESVDVILSLQVLEHVPDVDHYLAEAQRVLKPGGLLWLTTHGMWPYHPTPGDYYRWTLSGLKRVIGGRFHIVDTDTMMGAPAYSFMIHLRIWWHVTRRLNQMQAKILNRLTGKRWGKEAPREKRLTNPILYVGNLLFWIIAPVLNMLMEVAEKYTSGHSREVEAAVFRVAAKKSVQP